MLAIQKPHLKDELTGDSSVEGSDVKNVENNGNQRKSSRVKKLKTFKDEIVYYPPSSTKTYNITLQEASTVNEVPPKVKRKSSVTSQATSDVNRSEVANESEVKKQKIQSEQFKRIIPRTTRDKKLNPRMQGYLKSVKLARTKKASSSSAKPIDKQKLDQVQKDKKRKKKKDLIKKLIESSQLQLKKQQELIELQLKQHRHEKTKRKMLKLLKKQRLIEEQRNFTMENLNNIQTNSNQTVAPGTIGHDPFLPIRCNFSNCDKTFRKQSLLEYHLKYHHYVDAKTFNNYDFEQIILSTPSVQLETLTSKKPVSKKTEKCLVNKTEANSVENNIPSEMYDKIEEDPDWQEIYSNDKNEDPYDIVHCLCGDHSSIGFMIQVIF